MNKSSVIVAVGLLFVSTAVSASPIGDLFNKLKSLNLKKSSLKQSAFPIPYVPDEFTQKGRRYLLDNDTNELINMDSAFER